MNAYSIGQIFVFIWIILCSYFSIVTSSTNVTESQVNTTSLTSNIRTTSEDEASAVLHNPAANEDSFNVNIITLITNTNL